jgi:hypothetical protein
MNTLGLFLDDVRYPEQVTWVQLPLLQWTIIRNYNDFVNEIQTHGIPAFVTFDHDLAAEHYVDWEEIEPETIFTEKTGYDCAQWLVNYCMEHHLKFPPYSVHSMNPVGKTNIISYIENAKKHVQELN